VNHLIERSFVSPWHYLRSTVIYLPAILFFVPLSILFVHALGYFEKKKEDYFRSIVCGYGKS